MRTLLAVVCAVALSAAPFTVARACLILPEIAASTASTGGSVGWAWEPAWVPEFARDAVGPVTIFPSTPDDDDLIQFYEQKEYWSDPCGWLVPRLSIDHQAKIVGVSLEQVWVCQPGEGGSAGTTLLAIGLYGAFGPLEPGLWRYHSPDPGWQAHVYAFTVVPEPAALSLLGLAGLLLARRPRRPHTAGRSRLSRVAERRIAWRVRASCISSLLALALALPASAATFDLVATHPDAVAQPTALGQTIATLKPFNGKLYAGFGDANVNTGPIGVRAFDPATGAFGPQMLSAQTEALLIYREIGGKLYAPHIDPWPSPPPPDELGGYSLGVVNGATETWSDHRLVPGIHMFDVATYTGDDLWIVGSRPTATGSEGVAWRSLDGGQTWQVSLVVPPEKAGVNHARLYAIHPYHGKLYTQGQDVEVWGPQSTSKVFDGTTWSDGPTFGMGYIGNMFHPETFAGEMVYHRLYGGATGGSRISKFNGTRADWAYTNELFYDYTIDEGGDDLYALLTDGRIIHTTDLVSWNLLATAPSTGRSLGVLGDRLYVGGTGGQLFRYSVPVPEPAMLPLTGLFALMAMPRRRRRYADRRVRDTEPTSEPRSDTTLDRSSPARRGITRSIATGVLGVLTALILMSHAADRHWTLPRLGVTRDPLLDKLACAIEAEDADALRRLLLGWGMTLNRRDDAGLTPLGRAARAGWFEGCRMLIDHGAGIDVADADGVTPLMYAVRGDDDAAKQISTLLIEKGAVLEARSRVGTTALTLAVMLRKEAMVRLLLDAGADPEAADAEGDTPLDVSRWVDDREHEALLEARRHKPKP